MLVDLLELFVGLLAVLLALAIHDFFSLLFTLQKPVLVGSVPAVALLHLSLEVASLRAHLHVLQPVREPRERVRHIELTVSDRGLADAIVVLPEMLVLCIARVALKTFMFLKLCNVAEHVVCIEAAPPDGFPSSVTAARNVEGPLVEREDAMVAVEWTEESCLLVLLIWLAV